MASDSARTRVRIGDLWVDALRFDEAVDRIEALAEAGAGGAVYTPNVDHVVLARRNPRFREAYQSVSLSLADGQPIVWCSPLVGHRLPEKISGSDIVWPVLKRAGEKGLKVFLLGGREQAAREVAAMAQKELGVNIVGIEDGMIPSDPGPENDRICRRIREADTQVLLVALGAPKGEIWIHNARAQLGPAVALSIGATLDFIAGHVVRAPKWMQRAGLEWLFRLGQEPRRLARRYLLDDPQFLKILAQTRKLPTDCRVARGVPWEA